ncbi:hypothetical protein LT42_10970 [Pseudomonas lutea]|uniref:Uncharacterized protein n=1 Tax=Pseudomonas lutea TaxID=243924 RepID=A0A9X0JKW9_9PSED|nr:hypothetical protein LT42_10970 [Pseudomonas lutea]
MTGNFGCPFFLHSPASRLLRILCEAQILVSAPILRILCRAQILIITPIHCRSRLAGEPDLRYAHAASEHMQSTHDDVASEHMQSATAMRRLNASIRQQAGSYAFCARRRF